jgi:hypothetical protein
MVFFRCRCICAGCRLGMAAGMVSQQRRCLRFRANADTSAYATDSLSNDSMLYLSELFQ